MGGRRRAAGRRLLPAPRVAAVAALSLDRLLRQPRPRERDHGHRPGRGLRPPQRRQPRRAHRSQLPVGHAVRDRGAGRAGGRRLRPPRVRRGRVRARRAATRPDRQLAAPRPGRRARARGAARIRARGGSRRPALPPERGGAGHERLPHDHRAGGLESREPRATCTASSTGSATACCATSPSAPAAPPRWTSGEPVPWLASPPAGTHPLPEDESLPRSRRSAAAGEAV